MFLHIFLGQLTHLLQPTQVLTHVLVKHANVLLQVLAYLLVSLQSTMVAEVGHCAVAVDLGSGLADRVVEEATAVVELVENSYPARNQIQNFHFVNLVLLLLPLGQPLVRSQLIDVRLHSLLLLSQQILKHAVDVLGVFE